VKRFQNQIPYLFLFLYLILIFASSSTYTNYPKLILTDIIKFPLHLSDKVFYNLKILLHSNTLIKENKDLYSKLQESKGRVAHLEEIEAENERLKVILSFKNESPFDFIACPIIAKDPTNLSDSILIGAGKKHGINEKTVVITPSGVVGKVAEIFSNSSRVLLITDPDSHISAIDLRSRCEGMLYGISGRLCRMEYLPLDADIKKGDSIITSSFSGFFPKGLLLGEVVEVAQSPNGLSLYAIVKPQVDFSYIEEVLCIR